MEKFVSHEIERKPNGTRIVRNYFICENKKNINIETHKEFNKNEKKEAKLNFKIALKNKSNYIDKRNQLIKDLVNCPLPKFNVKFTTLVFS